ncbi:hypothetical protein WJX74_000776 [Apatococcus lobatus]|uniref:Uncharacterized protein n=1 Tax=Apatococcus lobatus TaxID=904363 RepID=A0AAW1QLV8_9CHLO
MAKRCAAAMEDGLDPRTLKMDLGIKTLRNQSVEWIHEALLQLKELAAKGLVVRGYEMAGTMQALDPAFQRATGKATHRLFHSDEEAEHGHVPEGHEKADEYHNELHGLFNSNMHLEEGRGLIVEQLFRGLVRPTRLDRARESRQISLPTDMFSSDSEAEPDSSDEAYDADGKAFAEVVNSHAEEEPFAADEIQEGSSDAEAAVIE